MVRYLRTSCPLSVGTSKSQRSVPVWRKSKLAVTGAICAWTKRISAAIGACRFDGKINVHPSTSKGPGKILVAIESALMPD